MPTRSDRCWRGATSRTGSISRRRPTRSDARPSSTPGCWSPPRALPGPFHLLELGASAGLNLNLDHYRYDLGGLRTGDPASPLELRPEWRGPPPPDSAVRIAMRRGVDLNPPAHLQRLLAYVWPDQAERLAQAEAAIGLLEANRPPLDRGDAAEWVEMQLASPPPKDGVRVIMHSVAYQYFAAATQARVIAAIEAAEGPRAWLRMEKEPGEERFSLRLRLWPGGEDRLLAWTHPHGRQISWLEPPAH